MDGAWVAAAAFVVNAAVVLVGGGIAYARQEGRLQSIMTQTQREADEKINTTIRQFGETAQAIRQKITEVELFMRDNYIKRDSYFHGLNELASSVKNLGDGLDGRLIRMENKIDAGHRRESGGP